MIAKVIVDVPLMQTDKPYSYEIPSEFEDMVEAGMRVHVPFGIGNRLIQGIVTEVSKEADTPEELKSIVEVLHSSFKSRTILVSRPITKKCVFL